MKLDWKAALPVVDFHPRMLFSIEKCLFLWLVNSGVNPPIFKIRRLKLQKLQKSHAGQVTRNVNCVESSVELTLLGLSHIVKGCLWSMAKYPRVKVTSTLARSFQQELCWEMDIMSYMNFTFSINNKDQLRDLHNI